MPIVITAKEKQILREISIPPRPEVLLNISAEARKPEPDVDKIATYIAEDISISAAVLQIVNSLSFRRAATIKSIHQAVMVLGLRRLFPLVKAVALKSTISADNQLDEFWHISNTIAHVAAQTTGLLGHDELVDDAYMLGLFHLSGIPVMFQAFQGYASCYEKAMSQGIRSVVELERNEYGTSHPTLGALIGQEWKLPKEMINVIYYMQDSEGLYQSGELSDQELLLLSILKISSRAVFDKLGISYEDEWLQVEDDLVQFLDIDETQLEDIILQLQESID